MVEEKWYIYSKEDRRFIPIRFNEIPNNPGHIFLGYRKYDNEFFLGLFSPYGELILEDDGRLGDKKSNKMFEDKIKYFSRLSHDLCK